MHNTTTHIRVWLAHPQPLVQAGLAATLAGEPGLLLDDEARAGTPDVVLTDLAQGLALAASSDPMSVGRGPGIVVVTSQVGAWQVRQAIGQGIRGIHLIGAPLERLVTGVRRVAAGQRSLDEGVMAGMVDSLGMPELTQREGDVLSLLAEGACNKEIARRLDIALGTVKAHVRALLDKLQVDSRTQAIVVAQERGIVGFPTAAGRGASRPAALRAS